MTRIFTVILALLVTSANALERDWGRDRSIEQISESVYRWGSDNQYGAYIVNSGGIIVVDGHYCPSGTVQWLKEELKRRYDVPVKYVILTHDHQPHICNTQVFNDTAQGVSHRSLRAHVVREQRVSIVPTVTFDDSMDLFLGDLQVSLRYLGPSHSDNLIQVHIPSEKVLIAVDMAKGKSLFPDYRDMDVHNTLNVLRQLANLEDVDVVLPGHGPVTTQQAFRDSRKFIQSMHDQVLAHQVAGRSLAEIRDLITMDEFSDYRGMDIWLDSNIVTMYNYLYRYREPNTPILPTEAVSCREDLSLCRTSD
jgi:glyoxylase-like metal-dependent hydrolase (beta-lactamase superfamily II)